MAPATLCVVFISFFARYFVILCAAAATDTDAGARPHSARSGSVCIFPTLWRHFHVLRNFSFTNNQGCHHAWTWLPKLVLYFSYINHAVSVLLHIYFASLVYRNVSVICTATRGKKGKLLISSHNQFNVDT